LYKKQPTQNPAALSIHVNMLHIKAIVATADLKTLSSMSSLRCTKMKQVKASINPIPE
jgi:hypothetical protein